MKTPHTEEGLAVFDGEPAARAAVLAWTEPGANPTWHAQSRALVRDVMPVLARALDRLAKEAR